jgi:hypothetical protein
MLSFILGIVVGVTLGWNVSIEQVKEKFRSFTGK